MIFFKNILSAAVKKKTQKLSYVERIIFYNFFRNNFMLHIIQNISAG
jgi:hypothetical protein